MLEDLLTTVSDRHGHSTSQGRCDSWPFVSGDPYIWVLPGQTRQKEDLHVTGSSRDSVGRWQHAIRLQKWLHSGAGASLRGPL